MNFKIIIILLKEEHGFMYIVMEKIDKSLESTIKSVFFKEDNIWKIYMKQIGMLLHIYIYIYIIHY